MPRALTATLMIFTGCAAASSAVTNAVANSVVAGIAAGANAATGRCVTTCGPGSRCNEKTQLCELIPCNDRCSPSERCEPSPQGDKCVPKALMPLPQVPAPSSTPTAP